MKNEYNEMILGNVNLKDYLVNPTLGTKERTVLERTLEKLKKDNLSSERLFKEEVEQKLKSNSEKFDYRGYSQINLSFLQKTNKIENPFSGKEIVVPSFSFYRFYGNNEMKIDYEWDWRAGKEVFWVDINQDIYEIDEMLANQILKGIEVAGRFGGLKKWTCLENYFTKMPSRTEERYRGENKDSHLTLSSYFNGLIPEKTKEKVEKAKESFRWHDIYLICETKPEDWNIKSRKKEDPLVIGLNDKKAYFIDHFNCTPLENLVKDNYVGGKLN